MPFCSGDLVVYGTTGVCRIEEICKPGLSGTDRNREYYLLKPLHQDGVIYAPVDHAKVPMRPVISAREAEELIDLIPTLHAEACRAPTLQALAQHYQSIVRNSDCKDLMELMMSIYTKRCQAEQQNRRLGMMDERYMKQAERLLYGEFSAALGIPYDDVQAYIAVRVEGLSAARS